MRTSTSTTTTTTTTTFSLAIVLFCCYMLASLFSLAQSLSRQTILRTRKFKPRNLHNLKMPTSTELQYQEFRKHPQLFTDTFDRAWLHEDFIKITEAFQAEAAKDFGGDNDAKETKDPETIIPELLHKEMDGVYSFNVFNDVFLQLFNEEIENFYGISARENIPVRRPNSMNNYGVIVNEIGMRPLISSFQQNYLWPVARQLFPEQASQFDDHHSFIVRYNADEDLGLDMHTDDSDVTFNVCLGDEFTGATLSFCGMFGAPNHRQHTHTYHHQVGRAILHLGSRRHGADDIETGKRANLIVWNHNWEFRKGGGYRNVNYHSEEGPPSSVCLSYTHDRDYQVYKKLPEQAKKLSLRPWCPPPGTEYEGFDASKRVAANEDKEL